MLEQGDSQVAVRPFIYTNYCRSSASTVATGMVCFVKLMWLTGRFYEHSLTNTCTREINRKNVIISQSVAGIDELRIMHMNHEIFGVMICCTKIGQLNAAVAHLTGALVLTFLDGHRWHNGTRGTLRSSPSRLCRLDFANFVDAKVRSQARPTMAVPAEQHSQYCRLRILTFKANFPPTRLHHQAV